MSLEQLITWLNTLEPASKARRHVDAGRASGAALAAITAIVGRFNVISEGLSNASKQHAPIFEKADDGTVLPQPLCMGFLAAMRLRFEAWRPLRDLNRIEHALLLPTHLKRHLKSQLKVSSDLPQTVSSGGIHQGGPTSSEHLV